MVNQVYLISLAMSIAGLAIIIYLVKNPPKKIRKSKNIFNEVEKLQQLKQKQADEKLKQTTIILKDYLKQRFGISNRFSLNEISQELALRNQKNLQEICESLKKYYYTEKQPNKNNLQLIIDKLINEIENIEKQKQKELIFKKQNQTFVERLKSQEQNIKENIRIQKIRHSRLKNKK